MTRCQGVLLELMAHVSGWEVVMKRWETNNFENYLPLISHPGEKYLGYIRATFLRLKNEQQTLLALTQPGRRGARLLR